MADVTEALYVKVGTASADVMSSATADVKCETDGASGIRGVEVNFVAEVEQATVANDKFEAEATVEAHSVDTAALEPDIEAELKAEALSVKAATGSTEAKLKTQADAIKAIEANPVAEKATATAPVTADAPEAKPRATSTDEPLSDTAFVARQVTYYTRRCHRCWC